MSESQEKVSTVRELADRFKVSDRTIKRWFHSHQIEAIQIGRQLRFEEKEVKRFMDLRRRARDRQAPLTRVYPLRPKQDTHKAS